MKKKPVFILLLFLMGVCAVRSQEAGDTLSMAKSMLEKGKVSEPLAMMAKYRDDHPEELYANWIYAQVAGMARQFNLSEKLYQKALHLAPNEQGIRLDYARMLAGAGKLEQAKIQFDTCAFLDPDNPEPWYWLARIHYWRGEYIQALELTDNLIRHAPNFADAMKLKEQIREERAPWIGLESPFSFDDQPLHLISPAITGGWHRSNMLGLDLKLYAPLSTGDTIGFRSFGLSAGNTFHFPGAGLNLYLNLGLFNHSALKEWNWTGEFRIEKSFLRKWKWRAEAWRHPYVYTVTSLQRQVFENHFMMAFTLDDPDRWNGQVSVEASTFSVDNNYIASFCGWLFVPAIKTGRFDFHFGYGYNYSDAKENTFSPDRNLDEIVNQWNTDSIVEGVYDPYFTPNHQQVHSLLGIINFNAGKQVNLSLKFNAGVYATTQYPYLYPDGNDQDSLFINRSFVKEVFHPFNITAGLGWKLPHRFSIGAEFSYNSTIYYRTFTGNLSIRKKF